MSIKIKFWDSRWWTAPQLFQSCMLTSSPYSTRARICEPTFYTDKHSNLLLLSEKWPSYTLSILSWITTLTRNKFPEEGNLFHFFFFFFLRDYPPLHQSWRGLVLCGLKTIHDNINTFLISWTTYFAIDISFEYIRGHGRVGIPYPYSIIRGTSDEWLRGKHLSDTVQHLGVHLHSPDAGRMIQERPMLADLLEVVDIPYIYAVIVVDAGHLVKVKEKIYSSKSWQFVPKFRVQRGSAFLWYYPAFKVHLHSSDVGWMTPGCPMLANHLEVVDIPYIYIVVIVNAVHLVKVKEHFLDK